MASSRGRPGATIARAAVNSDGRHSARVVAAQQKSWRAAVTAASTRAGPTAVAVTAIGGCSLAGATQRVGRRRCAG